MKNDNAYKIDSFDKSRFGKAVGSVKIAGISSIFAGIVMICSSIYLQISTAKYTTAKADVDSSLFYYLLSFVIILVSAYIIYNGIILYKLPNKSGLVSRVLIGSTVATSLLSITLLPLVLLIFLIVALTRKEEYEEYIRLCKHRKVAKKDMTIIKRHSDTGVRVATVIWSIVSVLFAIVLVFALLAPVSMKHSLKQKFDDRYNSEYYNRY